MSADTRPRRKFPFRLAALAVLALIVFVPALRHTVGMVLAHILAAMAGVVITCAVLLSAGGRGRGRR